MWEQRKVYRLLVVKPEGERPPGRPRYAWMDNIKMGFRETGWSGMDLFDVAEDSDRWMALARAVP
jgi:hypothetical protein